MACQAVQTWSFSGLVAAFIDLAIAYLLLCASAVAYLASNFLGLLGLSLPCPCDGMFINFHNKSLCFNRLLIDYPTQKVADVQICVKQKFPFSNSKYPMEYDCSVDSDNCVNGILEIEGEASCSSVSDARRPVDVVWREPSLRSGKFDVKGKGVLSHRPRGRLRHRKGDSDPTLPVEVLGGEPYSHLSTEIKRNGSIEDPRVDPTQFLNPVLTVTSYHSTSALRQSDDNEAPKRMRGRHRSIASVEMNQSPNEDTRIKQSTPSIHELHDSQQEIQSSDGDEKNKLRLLEQKLEEERIACSALYIELEKERSAAATAADEAMAMILRIQEEKASIEMESHQYRRMIEEKSAYDAEEMNILKEILVRREKEKHFLEKEVEGYKQIASVGSEQLASEGSDNMNEDEQNLGLFLDSNEDPVLILHQLSATAEKKVATDKPPNRKPYLERDSSIQYHDALSNFEKKSNLNEKKSDLQEKEIIFGNKNTQLTSRPPLEFRKTTPVKTEELEQAQGNKQRQKLAEKIIGTCNGKELSYPNYDQSLKTSWDSILHGDTHFYDVHIVNDGNDFSNEATEDKSGSFKVGERRNSLPSTGRLETEGNITRSSSEIPIGLPPIGPRRLSLPSDLRRSPGSAAVDSEMLKIDFEIGRLRERLKLVQEGRERLGLCLGNQERENVQMKLLEDIARQVQEIRCLTEPRKAQRRVSLPPKTSKVSSKKRRSRSVSSGFHMSSEG